MGFETLNCLFLIQEREYSCTEIYIYTQVNVAYIDQPTLTCRPDVAILNHNVIPACYGTVTHTHTLKYEES